MRRLTSVHWCACLLVRVSVTPSTKSTMFGSRCLVHGLSERDEIWQLDRLDTHCYMSSPRLVNFGTGVPPGAPILKGVKIVTLFSYADSD